MKKIIYLFLILFYTEAAWAQSNWTLVGPVNRTGPSQSNGQGSGRIYSIAHHPQYNGTTIKTVFGASPFGGVWISQNSGATWSNSDADYPGLSTDKLNGCGVMDIIVDNTDPHILYAASYHATGTCANFATGTSAGVWKYTKTNSTTGGWTATGLSWPYPSSKQMYKLTMNPTNHLVILAGTSDGIYRTADGGAHWSLVYAHTTPNNFGIKNIVFRPGSGTDVYASADKVYKSTDGGINWTEIPGFPIANADWVDIAVTPAGYFYCYFLVGQTSYFYYYTTAWNAKHTFPYDRLEYNTKRLSLALHPGNSNIVYSGQEQLHRYNLTNDTWSTVSDYNGNMHADMHKIIFSPNNTELWVGHDGGISMANTNLDSGQPNWTTKNTGLAIATIYSFSGSPKSANTYLTGEEDNGNSYFNGSTWQGYEVCDGGDKMIDYDNPDNWYDKEEMYAGAPPLRKTGVIPASGTVTTAFDRANTQPFVNPVQIYWEDFGTEKPLIQDPRSPNVIYKAGINGLWRSSNYGATAEAILMAGCIIGWEHFVSSVAIAPTNPNYIYVNGYNKFSNSSTDKVLVTHNALSCPYQSYDPNTGNTTCSDANAPGCSCSCWADITPDWPAGYTTAQLAQNKIRSVVVSDRDPEKIWIGYFRTSSAAADRTANQIKMRQNGVWIDYNEGLPPDADINALIYERGSNDGVYAATTAGLYYRNGENGSQWTLFDANLPRAAVRKMEINYADNTIRVGMYGRGIWKSSLMCPTRDTWPLDNIGIAPSFFEANYITSANSLTTSNAATVFRATHSITLSPNFIADAVPGGSFLAFIHGCSSPGNSFPVKNEGDEIQFSTADEDEEEEHENSEENSIQALPNPGNGVFTLTFPNEDLKNILIYDMMGKIVFKDENAKENTFKVDITDQPAGIYLVKIMSGDKTISKKIIKQ